MKKIILILLSLPVLAKSSNAQSENSGPASMAVYGEFLGSGLTFSANFDMRFKGYRGLGFRIGAGYAGADGDGIISFPLGINALLGKGPHHFEVGASATLVTDTYSGFDDGASSWFFHPYFGYRYTKPSNSFNGRIYVGPIIASGFSFFPYGGISVGYTLGRKK